MSTKANKKDTDKYIKELEDKIEEQQKAIRSLDTLCKVLTSEKEFLRDELNNTKIYLNSILNSKRYKLISKIVGAIKDK